MKMEIKIPVMGESVVEAIVSNILKPSGSFVKLDEDILELETDKVNQVLHAPQNGQLILNVKKEDTVKIGQVIGFVDTDAKVPVGESPPPPPLAKEQKPAAAPAPSAPKPPLPETKKSEGESARVMISDFISSVKEAPSSGKSEAPKPKVAEDKTASFTFPGRISAEREAPDATIFDEGIASAISEEKSAADGCLGAGRKLTGKVNEADKTTRKKMSNLRKVIASRLVVAKNTTAMLTTFNEVDMSAVMMIRNREKDNFLKKYGVKLGFMSFFVKAVVAALKQIPEVNAMIDGDEIVTFNTYDIGVAVSTERGLMVPIIKNCDQLNFGGIEKEIEKYSKKAREVAISIDDLRGGSFTITNGGVFGSLLSTPILNPPQSAILGMHSIVKRPVVVSDEIVIRPMMYVALSYDHRIVDGKEAVLFLVHLKQSLEDPSRLLLNL
jgi:2-oxoglutarate dehydrogenase E2 component (dihydrolipoamide succinyltransferase)